MCIVLMLSNVGLDSTNNPTFENISNLKKMFNYENTEEIFVKCCKRMTFWGGEIIYPLCIFGPLILLHVK
jgi:hypothetical protein